MSVGSILVDYILNQKNIRREIFLVNNLFSFFLENLTKSRKSDINLYRPTKEGENFAKSNYNRSGEISAR